MPSRFGYVSVPTVLGPDRDAGQVALQAWTRDSAVHTAREGYAFAEIFADVREQTETGLYRLPHMLRAGEAGAVLASDLGQRRTAARYLRARLLLPRHPALVDAAVLR